MMTFHIVARNLRRWAASLIMLAVSAMLLATAGLSVSTVRAQGPAQDFGCQEVLISATADTVCIELTGDFENGDTFQPGDFIQVTLFTNFEIREDAGNANRMLDDSDLRMSYDSGPFDGDAVTGIEFIEFSIDQNDSSGAVVVFTVGPMREPPGELGFNDISYDVKIIVESDTFQKIVTGDEDIRNPESNTLNLFYSNPIPDVLEVNASVSTVDNSTSQQVIEVVFNRSMDTSIKLPLGFVPAVDVVKAMPNIDTKTGEWSGTPARPDSIYTVIYETIVPNQVNIANVDVRVNGKFTTIDGDRLRLGAVDFVTREDVFSINQFAEGAEVVSVVAEYCTAGNSCSQDEPIVGKDGTLTITVKFDEEMDTTDGNKLKLEFDWDLQDVIDEDVTGEWTDRFTYQVQYDVSDENVEIDELIDVTVPLEFKSALGHESNSDYTEVDLFGVDQVTTRPEVLFVGAKYCTGANVCSGNIDDGLDSRAPVVGVDGELTIAVVFSEGMNTSDTPDLDIVLPAGFPTSVDLPLVGTFQDLLSAVVSEIDNKSPISTPGISPRWSRTDPSSNIYDIYEVTYSISDAGINLPPIGDLINNQAFIGVVVPKDFNSAQNVSLANPHRDERVFRISQDDTPPELVSITAEYCPNDDPNDPSDDPSDPTDNDDACDNTQPVVGKDGTLTITIVFDSSMTPEFFNLSRNSDILIYDPNTVGDIFLDYESDANINPIGVWGTTTLESDTYTVTYTIINRGLVEDGENGGINVTLGRDEDSYFRDANGIFIDENLDTPPGRDNLFTVDQSGPAVGPTVAIDAPAAVSRPNEFEVTIEFFNSANPGENEGVEEFEIGDVDIENADIIEFEETESWLYTITLKPRGGDDITIDVAADVATGLTSGVGNQVSEQAVVRVLDDIIVERTRSVIKNFMTDRAGQIAANDPKLAWRLINRAGSGGAFSTNGSRLISAGLGTLGLRGEGISSGLHTAYFETGLHQLLSASAARSPQAGFDGDPGRDPMSPRYDIWLKAKYQQVNNDSRKGRLALVYLGADYLVNPDLLVGVLGQMDLFDQNDPELGASASGAGWLAGPYAVARLGQNLIFEGRGAWGQSYNEVSPFNTYDDDFSTNRWLAKGALTGDFQISGWSINPTVSAIYFREKQKRYIDSNGLRIGSQTVELGQLKFGPTIARTMELPDGVKITPSLAVEGVWDFIPAQTVSPEGVALDSGDALRARIEPGVTVWGPGGVWFSATGNYDGIGDKGLEVYGGSVELNVPF